MLKYNYWRTVPPERDWINEPDFNFEAADYGPNRFQSAHMFYWLCGKNEEFRWIGGQGWPLRYGRGPQLQAIRRAICAAGRLVKIRDAQIVVGILLFPILVDSELLGGIPPACSRLVGGPIYRGFIGAPYAVTLVQIMALR